MGGPADLSPRALDTFAQYQMLARGCADEHNWSDANRTQCEQNAAFTVNSTLHSLPEGEAGKVLERMGLEGMGRVIGALQTQGDQGFFMSLVRQMIDGKSELPPHPKSALDAYAVLAAYDIANATGHPVHLEHVAPHVSPVHAKQIVEGLDAPDAIAFVGKLSPESRQAVLEDLLENARNIDKASAVWVAQGNARPEETVRFLTGRENHHEDEFPLLLPVSKEWPSKVREVFLIEFAGERLIRNVYSASEFAEALEAHVSNPAQAKTLFTDLTRISGVKRPLDATSLAVLAGSLQRASNKAVLDQHVKDVLPKQFAQYKTLSQRYEITEKSDGTRTSRTTEDRGLTLSDGPGGTMVVTKAQGAAKQAGLKPGDVIKYVNDQSSDMDALRNLVFFEIYPEASLKIAFTGHRQGVAPGTLMTIDLPPSDPRLAQGQQAEVQARDWIHPPHQSLSNTRIE